MPVTYIQYHVESTYNKCPNAETFFCRCRHFLSMGIALEKVSTSVRKWQWRHFLPWRYFLTNMLHCPFYSDVVLKMPSCWCFVISANFNDGIFITPQTTTSGIDKTQANLKTWKKQLEKQKNIKKERKKWVTRKRKKEMSKKERKRERKKERKKWVKRERKKERNE